MVAELWLPGPAPTVGGGSRGATRRGFGKPASNLCQLLPLSFLLGLRLWNLLAREGRRIYLEVLSRVSAKKCIKVLPLKMNAQGSWVSRKLERAGDKKDLGAFIFGAGVLYLLEVLPVCKGSSCRALPAGTTWQTSDARVPAEMTLMPPCFHRAEIKRVDVVLGGQRGTRDTAGSRAGSGRGQGKWECEAGEKRRR